MSLKNIFILLTSTVLFCQNGFSQKAASHTSNKDKHIINHKTYLDSLLDEVNSKFTIDGKPINPRVIYDLANGDFDMKDGVGIITSLDLLRANYSSRYHCDSCFGKTSFDFGVNERGWPQGYFSYKYLGKTTNNIHVVETSSNGGGSYSWGSILFFSVHIRTAYEGYEKGQQFIMTLEGYAPSGGGAGAYGTRTKITIQQNKVIVDYTTNERGEGENEYKTTKEREEYSF